MSCFAILLYDITKYYRMSIPKIRDKIKKALKNIINSFSSSKKIYTKWRFARVSGIDYRTILRYCKSELKNIKLDILLTIYKTLDCSVSDIFEYKKD